MNKTESEKSSLDNAYTNFCNNLANVTEIHSSLAPTVILTSVYDVKEPGVTFLVNITVTDVYSLVYWVIDLEWDPNIIKISTGDTNGLYKRGTNYKLQHLRDRS